MPRTTLDLDTSVLGELRLRGQRQQKSMGVVASELLAAALAASEQPPEPPAFRWAASDLGVPRVELEDSDALYAVLDAKP